MTEKVLLVILIKNKLKLFLEKRILGSNLKNVFWMLQQPVNNKGCNALLGFLGAAKFGARKLHFLKYNFFFFLGGGGGFFFLTFKSLGLKVAFPER